MARLVLCLLAVYSAAALGSTNEVEKVEPAVLLERQLKLLDLFQHINEPATSTIIQSDAKTFKSIEDNLRNYGNLTAAKNYIGMLKHKWVLPRSVPFSVNEPAHAVEALTVFNVLYSAIDYDTFYNTAAYLRDKTNEGLFVYSLSIAIIYRKDTQNFALPPIYETFPTFFNNAEIMAMAHRINVHGKRNIEHYPATYTLEDNIIIKDNETKWSFFAKNPLYYFTNDYGLNAAQYFLSLVTPYWLGGSLEPHVIYKERRGEAYWFAHRQLLAIYYMNRLTNGLGEVQEYSKFTETIEEGHISGLVYSNGVPFPSRPDHYRPDQTQLASAIEQVEEYERRLWVAIDKGRYIDREGKEHTLLTDAGLDILGRLIESNADSPNRYFYKDFIRIAKQILGNSVTTGYTYDNDFAPLVVPSALENYQTSLRDPAFYVLWKRILKLFVYWQKQMPLYKPEELTVPNVEIEKIEVDKMVTFFESSYLNVTSSLYQNEHEAKSMYEDTIVLVKKRRLNHKSFSVRVSVKSDTEKKVLVKLFLAPKYDSKGLEIPLQKNTENFFMLDQFFSELKAGESVITRKSDEFSYVASDPLTTWEIFEEAEQGKWSPTSRSMSVYPCNLLLPKGTEGGYPFQIVVYIQDFDGFKQPYTPGYRITGFPSDRPLYKFQIKHVKNLKFQDVKIYHED